MDTQPYGKEAFNAFTQAMRLVKEGKYDEARKVNLIPSDRIVIERRISEKKAQQRQENAT
jgi:hypothetical protein